MGRALSIIVAAALAVAAFAFGVGVSGVFGSADTSDLPTWRFPLAIWMALAGLGLEVAAIVRLLPLRKQYGFGAWRGLTRQQRRYATRQLTGKWPVNPHEVDFLRVLASQRRGQRVMALQPAGLMLLSGAMAVNSSGGWQLGLAAGIIALATLSLAIVSWDVGRMVAFLDRHGWVGPPPHPPHLPHPSQAARWS